MEKKQKKVEEENGDPQQQVKKRKRKDVFPFGNYRNYYGYRIGEGSDEDPRFKVLKKEWFEGKDCLDIGCNCGIVTIQIAKKFHCRSVLGIDIDSNRVEDAYWHLRKIVKMEQAEKKHVKASKLEVPEKVDGLEHVVAARNAEKNEISRDCSSSERDLFDIVSFRHENFVLSQDSPEKLYDTILCLSVTKWIHLNWSDDGLITLFTRIWRILRPGGIFMLEPQPWQSYEKNRRVSETTAMNYQNIMIRPEQFQEILLDKVAKLDSTDQYFYSANDSPSYAAAAPSCLLSNYSKEFGACDVDQRVDELLILTSDKKGQAIVKVRVHFPEPGIVLVQTKVVGASKDLKRRH